MYVSKCLYGQHGDKTHLQIIGCTSLDELNTLLQLVCNSLSSSSGLREIIRRNIKSWSVFDVNVLCKTTYLVSENNIIKM